MKYKPQQYAKALVDCILEKKADKKKIVKNFLALLEKNSDMKYANSIITIAEGLILKKTGNKKIILETARKTNTKSVSNVFAKKGDIVEEKINPALIAGIKIVVNDDRQMDMSLLHKLNKIFK